MTDPHALIDDLDRRTAAALRKAETAQAEIAAVTATATSEDGAATVTVNATGALVNVSFGRPADKLPKERLAEAVMTASRQAQTAAATRVTELMAPVIGTDSEAMRLLREQLPSQPRPSSRAPEDEHDYDQRNVLRKRRP